MNLKYHLLTAAAALSLCACSTDDTYTDPAPELKPEKKGYKISFTVAEDSETRTTLDAGDFLRWMPTDRVGVFTVGQNVNLNTLTTADVNQSPVEFVGTPEQPVSSGDLFYAYYPYNAAQSTDPAAVKLSIPAKQTQTVAGVYNGQSNPLVALPMELSGMSDSLDCRISSVRFRQLGAIVELQLSSSSEALHSETIRSVIFKSDAPLAGDFQFDLTGVTVKEELPVAGYESKKVTTWLEEPAAVPATGGEAARIYLTIVPGQYTGQIVVNTDAAQYTFRLKNAMTFERAVIKGLPADLAEAVRNTDFIHFKDPEVERICVENWDTNDDGVLSGEEAAAVTSIGSLFKEKSIRSFNELRYFTGLRSIGGYAFKGCSSLTSINIPDGVTSIGYYAFRDCSSLTSINIPAGVTTIGQYTFCRCSSLTNIHIPEGVTTIKFGAFRECSNLTTINIPDGVTVIEKQTFTNCSNLTNIKLPNGVTQIGEYAFNKCSSLTSINIPEGVTSIGYHAFTSCIGLTNITLPESVTTIGASAFSLCSNLTSLNIPSGVTSIGNRAFLRCSSLTSLTIPDGVTVIEEATFGSCSNLTSINLPNGVTTIGNSAFSGCSSLTNIHIPEGVTAIGDYVFSECSSLTSINIPDGVTAIGERAFNSCSSLTSVYCKPTTPPTLGADDVFYGASSDLKIYVPAASAEAYKTAANWSVYAAQIFADNN